MFIDMHVHCTELSDLGKYGKKYILVCVSDDIDSSYATLKLSEKYNHVKPCIGIHPWVVHEFTVESAKGLLEKLGDKVQCLGEVGLDKKFKPETYNRQFEIFKLFVEYAREYNAVLNLHAAGAWSEVFQIVYSRGINKAYFHWYTGPLDLADQITSVGYFIGANPAFLVQEKHRAVLDRVNLDNIITESDAPYYYRGLNMTPELIEKTITYLSGKKRQEPTRVEEIIYSNFIKLFK
jgi:TatD DNase family protein